MLVRSLLCSSGMKGLVEVRFRGIDPADDLLLEARRWADLVRDGIAAESPVDVTVFINRAAPWWGGSTAVSVEICFDGRRIMEVGTRDEPHDALRQAFTAVARRIGAEGRTSGIA
ncbi:MAG TPA: hypothetical protein VLS88_01650 [Polyangiales bacterium]|nr:hypothetical protein [Polyangiales bacterium]